MALSIKAFAKLVKNGRDLGARIYRAFTGKADPGRQTDAQRIAEVEKAAGSGRKAAAAAGVPESTWRSWRTRGAIPEAKRTAVDKLQRRQRLTPRREQNIRNAMPRMVFTGMFAKSDEPPSKRTVNAGQWFSDDSKNAIVNAFLSGDDEKLENAIIDALNEDYVSGDWEDVTVEIK